MAKETFDRSKPHVNIGTMVTLTTENYLNCSYYLVLARSRSFRCSDFDSIDHAPEEKERGITINTAHVEYQTITSLRSR